MSGTMMTDSQSVAATNSNDLMNILSGCASMKQPAVTMSSHLLRTHDWRGLSGALIIDLSRLNQIRIDPNSRVALVGPGTKISALASEAQKTWMAPEIEPASCIDFTFGDWAHESLRMLSTTNSGIDGILRNVKVVAPSTSYQTGYDRFPANGGGYDLTKMFMTSNVSLGIPYEFAVTLRPIQEVSMKKIYTFDKLADAIKAGIKVQSSGYARIVKLRSAGYEEMLTSGRSVSGMIQQSHLVVKYDGNQKLVELAESAIDSMVNREGGKPKDKMADAPQYVDPSTVNGNAWMFGIMVCDSLGLAQIIGDIGGKAEAVKRPFQYCVSDIGQTVSVLTALIQGPPSMEIVNSIGSHLLDYRIPLRGNPAWNPILGDSRAVGRLELLHGIKKILDPQMILNPHVMEAI